MPRSIPIFKDHDETYRADTCGPLIQAHARGQVSLHALCHGHYPGTGLPKEILPGVKSVGFWDARENQDWGLDWHRNEGVEVTFLESGKLDFAADNEVYRLSPGQVTMTRPWQLHRVGNPLVGPSRLHWIIVDVGVRRPNQEWRWPSWVLLSPPDLTELTNYLRHNQNSVWKATGGIRTCFEQTAAALEHDRNGSGASRLAVRINDLLLALLDLYRENKVRPEPEISPSERTVELFLADLRNNVEHLALTWTLGGMASSCGLGVTQFVRLVRALTNRPPWQYLLHLRLDAAAEMLRREPELSVTNIALRCGFSSSQYFAAAFQRRYSRSPTQWRDLKQPDEGTSRDRQMP
jgi:AraC family L-rhamnose operon regulatory protein RhaS